MAQATELELQQGLSVAGNPSMEEQQCEILQQYTPKPSLCTKENDHFSVPKLQFYLQQFSKVWKDFKTQFPGQTCCMGINHQFAIYTTVKEVAPLVIIESGVAAGRGTWMLRYAAGPSVPIFSLDPGDPANGYPGQYWKDTSGKTTYLTAGFFQDLALVRWDVYIPDPSIRERTLIILDDHQSSIERLQMLRRWGFRYAFYEDNYPFRVATSADKNTCLQIPNMPRVFTNLLYGDAYSPNTVCAPVPANWNFVLHKDRFGHKCKFLNLDAHGQNVKWYQEHLKDYFEFPAIFSRCANLTRTPLLGSDLTALASYGFPEPAQELWEYGHLYPALIELKPLKNSEQLDELHAALVAVGDLYKQIVTHQYT